MSHTTELFVMAAVWCVISAVLVRFVTPSWPGRLALFAILVGIPFWELPYGYYAFRALCEKDTAPYIYEKILPQSIVCSDYPFATFHESILAAGYASVEVRDKSGRVLRASKDESGKIAAVPQRALASRYCMTYADNIPMPWRVSRSEIRVVSIADRRVVAKQSQFAWAGMWWQEATRPVFGRGGGCHGDHRALIYVLKNGTN